MKLKAFKRIAAIVKSRAKAFAMLAVASAVVATFPVQFVKAVSIQDGSENFKVYTFTEDAREILSANEIDVSDNDGVEVVSKSGIDNSLTIKINRAVPVTLNLAGEEMQIETAAKNVGELLSDYSFTPDNYDEITPSTGTPITENMTVTVNDVEYETVTETKKLPYKTVKRVSEKLDVDETRVVEKGEKGEKTVTTITKTVNGKVVDQSITQKTDKKATNRIVEVGAKKAEKKRWMSELTPDKDILLDKNGVPVKYKKKLTGVASAYCTGTTCSTGVKVKQGYIAVDPSIIPYGTEMYIRTASGDIIYGYAIAADTGGFTSWGNTIADLYMYSYSDAVSFGRRNIEIYIL